MNYERRYLHEGSNEPIKQSYFDNFMMSFQTNMMDTVATSMTDRCKNLMTQLRTHCNGILNHMVSKMQSKAFSNLTHNADNPNNDKDNEIDESTHHIFFDSSTGNVEESENNSLMMSENINFQRANDLSVSLKHWVDGDEDEGTIRPLSTLTAAEEKNTPGIQDRYSRHRAIAEEHERCGSEKGNNYGKGEFYNVYKDHVIIGGKRKKTLKDSCKAIKIKNGSYRGNKRQRKS